ncbi:MAG: SMI1/KNR4 family protein [Planctomycetia bacterium]|nr:SMI1/KNR4 family protein [Planctomycetia bacterium]
MIPRSATSSVLIAAMCLLGCAPQSKEPTNKSSNPPTNAQMLKIKPIDGAPTLTEDSLREFETNQQCKLPDDYRRFLLRHNGGFPYPDCVAFKEAGRPTASDVFCFHAVDDERPWASMAWHLKTYADRIPKHTLPIAHDSCGNLWLLNLGSDQRGAVVFWDHGTFDDVNETDFNVWPRVAHSFQEFVDNLHEFHPLPEDEVLLSRYAMVQTALAAMAEREPGFNKFSVVDAAWDCDDGKDGKVQMRAVKYEVHASVMHTDGYARLRAAKGLIKDALPRLP